MSRLSELLERLPPATLTILGLNIGVYIVFQLFFDVHVNAYTLCPALVLKEPYRLVTSTVLHGSLMHIGMNMMSTFGLCAALEVTMGTTSLLLTTLGSMVMTPGIHVSIALVARFGLRFPTWWQEHSLGFSGILFHLSVLEAASSSHPNRSLFGMISVPSHLYPWALLVLLQVFVPHLSFIGHLAGILVGTAQVSMGYAAPHSATMERYCRHYSNFAPISSGEPWRSSGNHNNTSVRHLGGTVVTYVGYLLETMQVVMFGWRQQNSNVEIISLVGGGDDDDWVGLPVVVEGNEEEGDEENSTVESQLV